MDKFRIAILAAQTARSDHKTLHDNLSQAVNWLANDWQLAKPVEADFIFMLVTSIKSLNTLRTLLRSYLADKLIVATSITVDLPQIKWLLPFPEEQPCPSIFSIVNILSLIQENTHGIQDFDPVKIFDPKQYLAGIIEQCQQDNLPRNCTLDGLTEILLVPKENAYYFVGESEQLIPLALAESTTIKVTEVSDSELADRTGSIKFGSRLSDYADFGDVELLPQMGVKQEPKGNLNDLIWFSILVASKGRLLKSYSLNDKIFLQEIPEILQTDFFSQEYKHMVEILTTKPTSPIDLSSESQHSLFNAINFCNACTALNVTKRS